MEKSKSSMAQQIAKAAIAFEQRRTGNYVPKSVSVVLKRSSLPLLERFSPTMRSAASMFMSP